MCIGTKALLNNRAVGRSQRIKKCESYGPKKVPIGLLVLKRQHLQLGFISRDLKLNLLR